MTQSLDAKVVAAIDDLELAARLIVEGMRQGGNRSPFHGYSTEFRQHRPYRAGDDLKYLDWKLFARSDRLYTRQFRETTNVPVMLVVDTSASMAFPEEGVSKQRYAQVVAAALAYLASDQGNAVGLMTMQDGTLKFLPPRGGRPHLRTLLNAIDSLVETSSWQLSRVIDAAAKLMRRKGIIVVISDFYDDEEGTAAALRRMSTHGHDLSVLQVLSTDELDLAREGQVEFIDAESGARRLTDTAAIAATYSSAVQGFIARLREVAVRAGIDHALLRTDIAPEKSLREWLQRRGAGATEHGEHTHRPVAR